MRVRHSIISVEHREIHDFPDHRVGRDGSVWSRLRRHGREWISSETWYQLKQLTSSTRIGYSVFLRGKRFSVHRLVLEAFVGPCPEGMECRHLNGDPSDNRVENLAWGTHQDNMDDRSKHGTTACGERSGAARFASREIQDIRARRVNGESTETLANAFKTNRGSISRICRRLHWKSIE